MGRSRQLGQPSDDDHVAYGFRPHRRFTAFRILSLSASPVDRFGLRSDAFRARGDRPVSVDLEELILARCDTGYFCIACEEYVPSVQESELYLRYVMGEIPIEALKVLPDRHIRCHPPLAQYIVNGDFDPVVVDDPDEDKRRRETAEVARREEFVTRAWRRLQAIPRLDIALSGYPLPGVVPPPAEEFFAFQEDLRSSGTEPEEESEGRIFY